MRMPLSLALAGAVLLSTGPAMGDEDQVQHYAPKPSETLADAVANFSEYNRLVEEVLAKDELTDMDMERIHELTYTIEVALAKINETMGALPVTLEDLHLASEARNVDRLRGTGGVYLENAQTVIP